MMIQIGYRLGLIGCRNFLHFNPLISFIVASYATISLTKGLNSQENACIFSSFAVFTSLTYFFR